MHENTALFMEALNFTAAEAGFLPRLIEKDYFCTLALSYFSHPAEAMVFKGGTCLAKVHVGFYRLSEDLDFSISTPVDASRAKRSQLASGPKKMMAAIHAAVPAFTILSPLKGASGSSQYLAEIAYSSLIDGHVEPIKIEVSLREPLVEPPKKSPVRTLLLDPINAQEAVASIQAPCITLQEAMAEKFRAAMTRLEPAIRDFYDIDHAVRVRGLKPHAPPFVALLRQKLAVPGNGPVLLSAARLAQLRGQVDTILKPVLRPRDFTGFDLDRAFTLTKDLADAL